MRCVIQQGEPLVLIEVKRGGNIEGAERQLFEYAFHHPTPILILTNGRLWRFFSLIRIHELYGTVRLVSSILLKTTLKKLQLV